MEFIQIEDVNYNLNDEGHAVDSSNNVFKTKDEIIALGLQIQNDTPATIELEGVSYNLDKDGNAIDTEGKVIKTKDELVALNQVPLIQEVQQGTGIEITDENGNPIVYEDSIEGMIKREADVYAIGQRLGYDAALNEYFKANPDIANLAKYKQLYGSVDSYFERTDYTKLTIDESNKEQMRSIIIAEKIAKGEAADDAKAIADYIEADGKLADKSKAALSYLQKVQADKDTAQAKLVSEQEASRIQNLEKFYGVSLKDDKVVPLNVEGSLYDVVVNKGQIGELKIPTTGIKLKQNDGTYKTFTRTDLFEYIAIGEDGVSEADKLYAKLVNNPTTKAYVHLMLLLNGDLSQLGRAVIQQERVTNLRERLSKDKAPVSPATPGKITRLVTKFN